MVGNDIPLAPVLHATLCASNLYHSALADDISAGVAFIVQYAEDGRAAPDASCAGDVVGVVSTRRFVLAGCGDFSGAQLPRDLSGGAAASGKANMSFTTAAASSSISMRRPRSYDTHMDKQISL